MAAFADDPFVEATLGKALQRIADEMITLRGVLSGRMHLIAAIIPQLHPLPKRKQKGPRNLWHRR